MGNISKVVLGGAEYNIKDASARTAIEEIQNSQACLPSDQTAVTPLPTTFDMLVTTDVSFKRYKKYYKKVDDTYELLVLGTDYQFGKLVAECSETVYEQDGWSLQDLATVVNSGIGVYNNLIPAHLKAATGGDAS